MRKSILHDFYVGNVAPWEQRAYVDPKAREITKKADDEDGIKTDDFKKKLASEEREVFEQIKKMEDQIDILFSFENFSYGFRLGVMFMTDTFMSDDDFIHDR